MRCKNCGWPNQPGEKNCVKCHAPLEKESVENNPAPQTKAPATGNVNVRKTVLEPSMASTTETKNNNVCVQCGFPLRQGAAKCPKCGTPVSVKGNEVPTPRHATVLNPEVKTINPYIDGFEAKPACSLKPIKRSNEVKVLDNIDFEGEEIALNRSNTDVDNVTISTECQAHIVNENGKWYIIDQSDAKTTFVRAGEKTEIKDGSIILLGNRLFEFHA